MTVRPISLAELGRELAPRVIAAGPPGAWLRVGLDGAPSAGVAELAEALAASLRAMQLTVHLVDLFDFLRPASVRWEHGRQDPDAFYSHWFDLEALRRETLEPLEPGGTGLILTRYWDAARERSARAPYLRMPEAGIVIVFGPFLLGKWLPLEFTVHCSQNARVLQRRTDPAQQWTLAAFERYAAEVEPEGVADVTVRMNDPSRPALVE